MQPTEQLSVTLPTEIARIIRDKVTNGEYATESEVISDSLLSLVARDHAMDSWLISEVLPAYDALRANPESAIPLSSVRNALAAEQVEFERHQR